MLRSQNSAFIRITFGILFIVSVIAAEGQNALVTIATNPPLGGTITGAGIYSNNPAINLSFTASRNWYLENVTYSGPPGPTTNGLIYFQPDNQFQKTLAIDAFLGQPDFDPTTLTNANLTLYVEGNCTVTGWFAPLAPTFSQSPSNVTMLPGSTTTLTASATGRQPIKYQWQFNGTNLPGQVSTNLMITNVQFTNSGLYTLVASNAFGVTNSSQATLAVTELLVLANEVPMAASNETSLFTQVAIQSTFSNAAIFYTLDGSVPDFNATPYQSIFYIEQSFILRVIAYSADFSQFATAGPFTLVYIPRYSLYAWGGGGAVSPPYGTSFASNSEVVVTATPLPGWTFMGWQGSVTGTNPVITVTMDSNVTANAVFGTALMTAVAGNGSISVFPQFALYPYGATVKFTPVPGPGSYFALWGGAANGTENPLLTGIISTQLVSALFAPLPTNEYTLTTFSTGGGFVETDPQTNKVAAGSTVVLTGAADYGQQFLGWSGDAGGTINPLSVVVNSNMTITGNFTRIPSLNIYNSEGSSWLEASGVLGDILDIEATTDLLVWFPVESITNFNDGVSFTVSITTSQSSQMYRVKAH